jgi:two-component system LytT family response regulator
MIPMRDQQLTAIVVDDEKPSREALSTYIRDFCPNVTVVSECDNAKSAYQSILEHHPKLVFLDIEMPNGDGFDLLRMFKRIDFKVIFVTAFSEYAIRAFRFSATDYLLKPVKIDELVEAVDKVRQELNQQNTNLNLQLLMEGLSRKEPTNTDLVIPSTKGFTVVKIPDLIMCEADGYCTHFYLTGKQKITSSKNLKHYEELLSDHPVMRVHHSNLINLKHVKGYCHQGEISLSEEICCPLGNNYKTQFLEVFGKKK